MRFKAKLLPEQLSLLYQVVVPMARIATSSSTSNEVSTSVWTKNSGILHLDDSFFRISTKGKSSETDNIQCYAEFSTARGAGAPGIFVDHRIESAAEGNVIAMEIDLAQLRMALQSLMQDKKHHHSIIHDQQQHYTILKLAKRNNAACLCLDAFTSGGRSGGGGEYSGGGSGGIPIQVHHSICVQIMRVSDMCYYRPPKVGQPDVQIELPLDRPLKSVMEGLKALGGGTSSNSTVSLHATTRGELTISLDSDGASIRAFFNHLVAHDNVSKSTQARVKVDTKKLCMCLQWQQSPQFPVSRAVLCLVENELLLVHVDLHPPSVGLQTYYIPIHYLPKDDDLTRND